MLPKRLLTEKNVFWTTLFVLLLASLSRLIVSLAQCATTSVCSSVLKPSVCAFLLHSCFRSIDGWRKFGFALLCAQPKAFRSWDREGGREEREWGRWYHSERWWGDVWERDNGGRCGWTSEDGEMGQVWVGELWGWERTNETGERERDRRKMGE